MKRFFHWALFVTLGSWLLACTGAPLLASLAPRSVNVSAERLQQAIAQRFPIKQRLAEVIELEVLPPRLSLLATSNRLATDIDLNVADRLLGGNYSGSIALDFGLRFEPNDNTIRMTGARVNRVSLAGVPEPYQTAITRNAPRLAERLFDNRVLHQFSDKDLSLVNGLGLEPGEITVTPNGLRVSLVPRPLSRP
ncbi:MAG: DUF1439 domain-containing protein [Polaromonas sp.]|nr:DUF1439 domain-containing protein [Polaromonas sp.]